MKIELYKRTNADGYALIVSGDLLGDVPVSFRFRDATKNPVVDKQIDMNIWLQRSIQTTFARLTKRLVSNL